MATQSDMASPALSIGVFGARGIPSTYGGYETFLTTLLPELAARGHSVTAYCHEGAVDGDEPYRDVQRIIVPVVEGKRTSTLSHGAAASGLARRAGHDVVLVVNPANALFCLRNLRAGQKVLLNTDGQEWLRGKWGRAARTWFRTSARLAKRCATGLIADGVAMANVYRDDFRAPSTVIPYCAPSDNFTSDPSALMKYDVERDGYFVIAARLNPENNVDTVADAYRHVRSDLPLLVLGKANYDSPVTRRLREISDRDDRVRLVGHVADRQTFLTLLSSARAYIHAHSVGGTNPSLIEAMRCGAMIAALDTAFNREALGDAGHYFHGGVGKVHDVAEVLDRIHGLDRTDADGLRRRAQDRVDERYSVDAVVSAYEALLVASMHHSGKRLSIPTLWSDAEGTSRAARVRRLGAS